MKAAVLTGIGQMEIRVVADPVLERDTDVLIRMGAVGVCGSDIHYYLTGRIGSQVVEYPYTVGHEGAGTVVKVGSAVTRVKPADRVAIDPAMACWKCDQCRAGRHHTCRKLSFLGCPGQAPGCFCEYLVMPEQSCYKIKDGMTLEQAAISEPLSIGVYAVKKSVPMAGAKIAILGCGPIGLSVLLPARSQGAERIYVTDRIDERLKVAENAGVFVTANPDKEDVVEKITALEPNQLDAVFECCGQQDALDQAIELLKPGGKLVLIGIPSVDTISFSIDLLRRKEICVQNIRRQVDCVELALDMIDRKVFDVNFMITHRFGLDDLKEAFDLVAQYGDGVVKAMIEIGGEVV